MKKKDFDNRLQNDLFPQMPRSFERKLQEAMESEGVKTRKRPTATGVFAGAIGVVAAAAVLLIVLMGVLSGGKSEPKEAAPGETAATAAPWQTKAFPLSTGFEFANEEKYQALCEGILNFLREQGEREPDELWLCAIKSRFVKEDTGDRGDGYLSGYYVLAQHAFGADDAPELYCLSEDFEVLWATEGSVPGPNHAVNPEVDSYAAAYLAHILYGTEPRIPEPGIPHVKRGLLVGSEPGTDIEFSMAASITEVQERLAGSAHMDAAKEYFLITVSARDWDSVMENPVLRFETLEGPVDVDMKHDLPKAMVALGDRFTLDPVPTTDPNPTPTSAPDEEPADPTPTADPNQVQGVEYWLSQNQPLITDLTAEWDDKEAVEVYGQAVARALRVSGEEISARGIWVLGVERDGEDPGEAWPKNAYVLARNVSDGETSPELFYYENGRIVWRTAGADGARINVVYHNGSTIVFGRSPAYDGEPLAMSWGKIVLTDGGSDQVTPVLSLEEIRERVTGGPYRDAARESFLWTDGAAHEVSRLTIAANIDGQEREFTLDEVNVLEPQPVPAMAVEAGGVIYPGVVTVLEGSLDEDGVAAEGEPLAETLKNGLLFMGKKVWRRPLTVLTAADAVTVDRVDVYGVASGDNARGMAEQMQLDGADLDLSELDALPAGEYYLCFRTTALGPYSEKAGRYAFTTSYTVYKVTLE